MHSCASCVGGILPLGLTKELEELNGTAANTTETLSIGQLVFFNASGQYSLQSKIAVTNHIEA
jgi:hypothetical protein